MSATPKRRRPDTDLPIFCVPVPNTGDVYPPEFQCRWDPDGSIVFLAPGGYRMTPADVDAYIEWLQNQKAPKA